MIEPLLTGERWNGVENRICTVTNVDTQYVWYKYEDNGQESVMKVGLFWALFKKVK